MLADGSVIAFRVFVGQVVWDGKVRRVLVDEADATPLLGMRLLRGSELNIQARYRGRVTIRPLPGRRNRSS
jgi:predicted aspartyl protease